jgi:hypothetical protein
MRHGAILLSMLVLGGSAAGCSDTTGSTTLGMEVASTPVELAAGQERWICWSFPVETPFQMIATELVASSPRIHHYQLFRTTEDPAMNATDCPAAGLRDAVWLSVGGAETEGVHYPEGTAMKMDGYVTLQLHVLNAADAPVTIPSFKMNLVGTDAEGMLPIGVVVVAPREISIPPGATEYKVTGTCNPPEDIENVVAIYPHMHKLGRQIRIGMTPAGGAPTDLLNVSWDFEHQAIYTVGGSATTADSLQVECTYDNPTSKTVTFGESTTDEMCAGIIYHYPAVSDFKFCGGR